MLRGGLHAYHIGTEFADGHPRPFTALEGKSLNGLQIELSQEFTFHTEGKHIIDFRFGAVVKGAINIAQKRSENFFSRRLVRDGRNLGSDGDIDVDQIEVNDIEADN